MPKIFSFIAKLALLVTAIGVNGSYLSKNSSSPSSDLPGALKPYYFRVPLDHFNQSDSRTFNNRYFVNDTYYQPGGPVFLFDGGEDGFTPDVVAGTLAEMGYESSVMTLARKYHGIAIGWEHRYFGDSMPFPLMMKNGSSVDSEGCSYHPETCTHRPIDYPGSYQWLTIDQALEDAIHFANNFELPGIDYPFNAKHTPWIFVGTSYPGSRAAFARLRSPETFYASWASSAVVQSRADGSAYFYNMERSMSEPCKHDVKTAIKYADEIMDGKHGKKAFVDLQKLIYVAKSVNDGLNSSYEISEVTGRNRSDLAGFLQSPFSNFQSEGPSTTIDVACKHMESYDVHTKGSNQTTRELAILSNPGTGKLNQKGIARQYGPKIALEAFIYGIERYSQTPVDYPEQLDIKGVEWQTDIISDLTGWTWLDSTAIGAFQGSNQANVSVISRYLSWQYQRDHAVKHFLELDPKYLAQKFNASLLNKFGGWNMNPTHVMFSHGQYDPWRAFGVASQDTNYGSPEREDVQVVPNCHTAPEDGTYFGLIYPGKPHAADMDSNWGRGGMDNKTSSMYLGVNLFSKALDVWLPCFNKS